jgi:hypothetical protein
VPEEFAAAYRAAYERALAAQAEEADSGQHADAGLDEGGLARRRSPIRVGTHRSRAARPEPPPRVEPELPDVDGDPTWFERMRDSAWFVPVLLLLLGLLLILGAYVFGRAFADRVGEDASADSEPSVVMSEGGDKGQKQPVTRQAPAKGAWAGKVVPLRGVRATAGCTSAPGVDAGGAKVSYEAANLTDGVADTTWRCDGNAVGEKITLKLDRRQPIGEVGLIPGYAKTDPTSKTDRYVENNRVTRVRWTIGDTVVVQQLKDAPQDRSVRLLRVPRTTADSVGLEILEVAKGARDTTAISEVELGRAG